MRGSWERVRGGMREGNSRLAMYRYDLQLIDMISGINKISNETPKRQVAFSFYFDHAMEVFEVLLTSVRPSRSMGFEDKSSGCTTIVPMTTEPDITVSVKSLSLSKNNDHCTSSHFASPL